MYTVWNLSYIKIFYILHTTIRDVEKAQRCKCLTSASHTLDGFTFVLVNYEECSVSYMGVGFIIGEAEVECQYAFDKSTSLEWCTHMQNLLFGWSLLLIAWVGVLSVLQKARIPCFRRRLSKGVNERCFLKINP